MKAKRLVPAFPWLLVAILLLVVADQHFRLVVAAGKVDRLGSIVASEPRCWDQRPSVAPGFLGGCPMCVAERRSSRPGWRRRQGIAHTQGIRSPSE